MKRAERRAAPKPARIPSGDRPAYSTDEGQT
jgi:branched-chain amino acid transport system permease protein